MGGVISLGALALAHFQVPRIWSGRTGGAALPVVLAAMLLAQPATLQFLLWTVSMGVILLVPSLWLLFAVL